MGAVRDCPACGGDQAQTVLVTTIPTPIGEFYRVVECRSCRMRYTRPLPTEDELTELYREEYYVDNRGGWLSGDVLRRAFGNSVQWRHRQALLGHPPGRILDVGCGAGDFLVSLKSRGWEVHATEFSDAAVALARKRGIAVHQGPVETAGFPDGFFDVATMWHVLEHLPVPRETLNELQRILKADGLLVVEAPNSASITFRLCGERWFPLDVPRHLQHFTPATLVRTLNDVGLLPLYRQNFHHWDFIFAFNSILSRLGVLDRLGVHHFSTDFKRASLRAKALFLLLGVAVGVLCVPYSVATVLVTGNSETLTITAKKVFPPRSTTESSPELD